VSRFQEKEKRGEMITKNDNLNDNINENAHPVPGKMITQKLKHFQTVRNYNIK
jgi:hypothetical protein